MTRSSIPWWSQGGSVATPQAAGQADPARRRETPPAGDRIKGQSDSNQLQAASETNWPSGDRDPRDPA